LTANSALRIASYSGMLTKTYSEHTAVTETGEVSATFKADQDAYRLAEGNLGLINPAVDLILGAGVFEALRFRWAHRALPGIVIGVVIASIGAGIFASNYQTSGSTSSDSSGSTPAEALISLTPNGRQLFQSKLGASCGTKEIQVIVLKDYTSGWLLQAVSDDCNPLVFNVNKDDVIIEGTFQPCPLPSSTPSGTAKASSSDSDSPPAIKVC
jgi:hypothetical protein